jgi:hypothetical protein
LALGFVKVLLYLSIFPSLIKILLAKLFQYILSPKFFHLLNLYFSLYGVFGLTLLLSFHGWRRRRLLFFGWGFLFLGIIGIIFLFCQFLCLLGLSFCHLLSDDLLRAHFEQLF